MMKSFPHAEQKVRKDIVINLLEKFSFLPTWQEALIQSLQPNEVVLSKIPFLFSILNVLCSRVILEEETDSHTDHQFTIH